jgi:hypothetical protein
VFTKNQVDVVRGVLDGTYDAGFLRTSQIEVTTDEFGQPVDPDLFKIIASKIHVMVSLLFRKTSLASSCAVLFPLRLSNALFLPLNPGQ